MPHLSITYGDYALWQREYLSGEAGQEQLAYWRGQLSGYENLTLPTDYERPAKVDYRGADYLFRLDEGLSGQLRELARARGTTLYTVALSALYATLYKLSGQRDIVVGTPSDNRHHAQTQSLIGMFVNSLALRVHWSLDETVSGLISRTHECLTQAKTHQDLPFEQLIDLLEVERDGSRHPIFQVMFSVQRFGDLGEAGNEALPFEQVSLEEGAYSPAKFDLSVFLNDSGDCIEGMVNYATGLFSAETIMRFTRAYEAVLGAFVEEQSKVLAGIDIVSAPEREQLLHAFNPAELAYPAEASIQRLFEGQVERTPDKVAVVYDQQRLTYKALNERANRLAHAIRKDYQVRFGAPMPQGTLIGLYYERGLDVVISMLAITKACGAYVPLSLSYPDERIAFILEDTASPLVLTTERYRERLNRVCGRLQSAPQILDAEALTGKYEVSGSDVVVNSAPDDLIYVVYTSGTTGKPKGVLAPQRGVTSLVMNNPYVTITEDDVFLLLSDMSFDATTFELWGPLVHGATLVVPEPNVHVSIARMHDLLYGESNGYAVSVSVSYTHLRAHETV